VYYKFIRKKLLIYFIIGIVFSLLIMINTVIYHYINIKNSTIEKLLIVKRKKEIIIKDTENIKNIIKKIEKKLPSRIITEEEALLCRADQIKESIPNIKLKLKNFKYSDEMVILPIIISFKNNDYYNLLKTINMFNFKKFPLFYYTKIIIKISPDKTNIECNIEGNIFILRSLHKNSEIQSQKMINNILWTEEN